MNGLPSRFREIVQSNQQLRRTKVTAIHVSTTPVYPRCVQVVQRNRNRSLRYRKHN